MQLRNRYIFLILIAVLIFSGICSPSISAENKKYKRSVVRYNVPDVMLVNQNGAKVRLKDLLNSNRPVIVDFIYATCTTICPVLSASFTSFQRKLGDRSANVLLVSFSIDPDNDTPAVMKEYLQRYQSKPGWDFVTGRKEDIDKIMKAFNVVIPDKMSHPPLYLMRAPGDDQWVRIYGLISSADFFNEYQTLNKK